MSLLKIGKTLLGLSCAAYLSACSTLNSVALYQVSEAKLNSQVAGQLPQLSRNEQIMGLPVTLSVKQATFKIGPEGRDVLNVTVKAQAAVSVFGLSYPVTLNTALEASPEYRSQDHSVYLNSLQILNSSISAPGYKGNLKPIDQRFQSLLNDFLANNPVYRLNEANPTERLLMAVPLNLRIKSGAIELTPKLN